MGIFKRVYPDLFAYLQPYKFKNELLETGPCPSIFSPLRRWQACSAGIAPRRPPLRTCKANEQGLRTSAGGRSPLAAGTRFGDREVDLVCMVGAKAALLAATKAEVFKRSQKPAPKVANACMMSLADT